MGCGKGGHKQEWLFTGRCWMYTGMLLIAVESKCFSRTLPHRMENTKISSKMETREIFAYEYLLMDWLLCTL